MSASSLPFPANSQQQRLCQGRYSHELALRIPLDGFSSPSSTLAAGLARYADGRPLLSIHVKSSRELLAMATSYGEAIPRCQKILPRHA